MRTNYVPKTGFSEIAHPLARGRSRARRQQGTSRPVREPVQTRPGPGPVLLAGPVPWRVCRDRFRTGAWFGTAMHRFDL